MKKTINNLLIVGSLFYASSLLAEEPELKVLGRTIIYEGGSWVNPDEPKFKIKQPKTWTKRNYVRHYMQGSEEITDSIIEINWKGFVEAAKTGDKIPMKDFIKVFRFKKTAAAVKNHPEAVVVPVGMAAGSAVEGGKGTLVATIGLLKNAGEITLKTLKFVSKPITKPLSKVIKKRVEVEK
jgi:hypothetical protein